jgi:hypothetical protein
VNAVLASGPNGVEARPVPLPGSAEAAVLLSGIDANSGRVRLTLSGIGSGVAARASLHKGESLTYRGTAITFDDFDLSEFDPQAGKIHIGAVFKVAGASPGKSEEVTAFYRSDAAGERHEDAAVPGLSGVTLRVGRMNANEKLLEVEVLDPDAPPDAGDKMRFSLDLTVKPLIGLLWAGLTVLLLGGILAVVRRGEEFSTPAVAPAAAGK